MIKNKTPIINPKDKILAYDAFEYQYNNHLIYGSKIYKGISKKNMNELEENPCVCPELLASVQDIYDRLDCNKTVYLQNYAKIPSEGLCLNSVPIFHQNYLEESLPVCISNKGFHLLTNDMSEYNNLVPVSSVLSKINRINTSLYLGKPVLIAQQIEDIFPELVFNINGKKGINYNGLIIYLIKAVQDLQN